MHSKDRLYKIYVTDCLQSVVNNTANFVGGSKIKTSYKELFYPDNAEENSKEADEIIADLKQKMASLGGGSSECI